MKEKFEVSIPPQENAENESIQPALRVLRETAEKFRYLDGEAEVALHSEKDTATHRQKLEERAQLLINLSKRLSKILEGVDSENKRRIVHDTKLFATSAQEALDNKTSIFMLGVLSTHRGSREGDKNDLEELISDLEK